MSDVQTKSQSGEQLKVTPEAIRQLVALIENEEGVCGVRIFVSGSGCSGVNYGMTFVEEPLPDDRILDQGDLRIYVDPVAFGHLEGVEIDFRSEGANQTFVFKNVAAGSGGGCGGCGSSGGGCA
jgi:iron-sulfur cluster assembly accessory protein